MMKYCTLLSVVIEIYGDGMTVIDTLLATYQHENTPLQFAKIQIA